MSVNEFMVASVLSMIVIGSIIAFVPISKKKKA